MIEGTSKKLLKTHDDYQGHGDIFSQSSVEGPTDGGASPNQRVVKKKKQNPIINVTKLTISIDKDFNSSKTGESPLNERGHATFLNNLKDSQETSGTGGKRSFG